jgi:hypothetical protein
MNFIRKIAIKRRAEEDAKLGIEQSGDTLIAHLGQKPTFDPVHNAEHAQLAGDLNNGSMIDEAQDDLRQLEDEKAKAPSLSGMNLLCGLAFIAELLGCVFVLRTAGVANPERAIFGAGLAALLFLVTTKLAKGLSRVWFVLLMAAYAAVVVAIAVLRADVAGGDGDASRSVNWAAAIVMLATTIGPAWLFEEVWRRRGPVAVLSKQIRNVKTRLWKLRRSQAAAERAVKQLARTGSIWERKHGELQALYTTHHRRVSARNSN